MTPSFPRIFAALALAGLSLVGQAQDLKIGYVNGERVLRESQPAKAAQIKLEAEFKKRENELNEQANKLRLARERLEKEAPMLSEAERVRRQRDLGEQQMEWERRKREWLEDLDRRKGEELSLVTERTSRVIRMIAEQEKFDLIVQEVLFASNRVDITKKVIDALNAGK